jgi:hypothetical protein
MSVTPLLIAIYGVCFMQLAEGTHRFRSNIFFQCPHTSEPHSILLLLYWLGGLPGPYASWNIGSSKNR